jgi:hypothetical protein
MKLPRFYYVARNYFNDHKHIPFKIARHIWNEVRSLFNRARGLFHEHQFHYNSSILGVDGGQIQLTCDYSKYGYYCGKALRLYYGNIKGDVEIAEPYVIRSDKPSKTIYQAK